MQRPVPRSQQSVGALNNSRRRVLAGEMAKKLKKKNVNWPSRAFLLTMQSPQEVPTHYISHINPPPPPCTHTSCRGDKWAAAVAANFENLIFTLLPRGVRFMLLVPHARVCV